MQKILKNLLFGVLFILIACQPQSKEIQGAEKVQKYDSVLAKSLHADEYGMSKYVIAFLKRGPNRPTDPAKAAQLQKEHLKNIGRMAREGKLILAGPFLDNTEIRGIYIFNVESVAEAKALTETDPAIQSGSLVMELHPWYASAALKQVYQLHKSIQKSDITQ